MIRKIKDWYEINRKIIFYFSLLSIFLLIFSLNYNTIYVADDYNSVWNVNYNFNLINVFKRTLGLYYTWTGRFVSTFINYVFLKFDKNIFNLINSLVFVVYIYLIYKIIINKERHNPFILILIFLLIWILIPQFGEVMLWELGSVIYLWTMTLNLFFVLLFIDLLRKYDVIKSRIVVSVLLLILGIIAGNGLETNSIMLVAIISAILIFIKIFNKKKLPIWSIVSYFGLVLGTFFNFLSPGNAARMETMGSNGSLMGRVFYGIGVFFYRGVVESKIFIVIPIIIVLYIIYLIDKQNNFKKYFNKKVIVTLALFLIFTAILFCSSIYISSFTLDEFLGWFYINAKIFVLFLGFLMLFFMFGIILLIVFRKKIFINTSREFNFIVLFLVSSALLGMSAYLMVPYSWPRSYMGMSTFLIMTICYIINNLMSQKINKYLKLVIFVSFLISLIIFSKTYICALINNMETKKWNLLTEESIQKQIDDGKKYVLVKTFMSNNKYNAASVEKWVIPIIINDTVYSTENGIHKYYEWINVAITNYYFNSSSAWQEGNRIIGY